MQKILELNIPIRLISEANAGFSLRNPKMTWIRLKKRKEAQKKAIHQHWMISYHDIPAPGIPLPCHVKLTRIAPRFLDDDNLAYSFKHIRDIIADLINPGYQFGRADAGGEIIFYYAQERGQPKQYAVRIEIYA